MKRLEIRSDGLISWSLPKIWRDGTKAFILTPYQFIARLVAMVPHPREHQLTDQGVLAPASQLGDRVVRRRMVRKELKGEGDTGVIAIDGPDEQSQGQRYVRWSDHLKRVFGVDVLKCSRWGGRRHRISVISDSSRVRLDFREKDAAVQQRSGLK